MLLRDHIFQLPLVVHRIVSTVTSLPRDRRLPLKAHVKRCGFQPPKWYVISLNRYVVLRLTRTVRRAKKLHALEVPICRSWLRD